MENRRSAEGGDLERLREKERQREAELESLRERVRAREEERAEGVAREERVNRQCVQVKAQLDACRREQERMVGQVKSMLAEKERMGQELAQVRANSEEEGGRAKELEAQLEQALNQKEGILAMLSRVRDAMPSPSMQRVFGAMCDSVSESYRLEEQLRLQEADLLQREGELRTAMKKEPQGLLSTKLIQLRKEVDRQRHELRAIQEKIDIAGKERGALEQEFRGIESTERRRGEVALETEKSLTEAKYEVSQLRKEVQFLNNNRGDLEIALSSINEEKRMLERELLALRSQLQMRPVKLGATLQGGLQ